MRLLRITLTDFRGVASSDVRFAPTGVTVVEGPNEVGKSSLPIALDLLLTELDSTTKRNVKAVQPTGQDVGPRVEVELRTGPYHLTYGKQFLRRSQTWLQVHEPMREQLTGREAHDRVLAILEETLDAGLWAALRVEQGRSLDPVRLDAAGALGSALDAVAGSTGAADRVGPAATTDTDDALVDRVEQEVRRYLTAGRGDPTGEYLRAQKQDVAASTALQELDTRLAELDSDVQRAEVLEARLAEHLTKSGHDAGQLAALEEELTALSAARADAATVRSRVDVAEAEVEGLRAEQRRRTGTAAATKEARTRWESAVEAHRDATAERDRCAVAGTDAQQVASAARTRVQSAQQEVRRADRGLDLARAQAEIGARRTRRARVADAVGRSVAAAARVAAGRVDADALEHVLAAERDLQVAVATSAAAAATIEVEPGPGAEVLVDGRTVLPDAGAQPVTATTVVRTADGSTITVRPGPDAAEQRARVEQAEDELAARLAAVGVGSVGQARAALAVRERAVSEQERADDEAAVLLEGATVEDLDAEIGALELALAPREGDPATDDVTDLEQATARREQVHRDLEAAQAEAEERSNGERTAQQQLADARAEHARAEQLLRSTAAEQQTLEDELAAARAERTDEALAMAVDAAADRMSTAHSALREAEEAVSARDPERLEARAEAARARVERARSDHTDLLAELNQVRGRLAGAEKEGLHDQRVEAGAAAQSAARRLRGLRSRAEAAELLHRTVSAHRDSLRARYVEPYRAAVTRLGRIVFGPDFDVEVSPDLEVRSRTLDGVTVPYPALSSGAREQLGLICRLAAANLVADPAAPGGSVPVVVDDALGHADPERLAMLGALLTKAGERSQVILLTCQPDRFASVDAAHTVRLERADDREPQRRTA